MHNDFLAVPFISDAEDIPINYDFTMKEKVRILFSLNFCMTEPKSEVINFKLSNLPATFSANAYIFNTTNNSSEIRTILIRLN